MKTTAVQAQPQQTAAAAHMFRSVKEQQQQKCRTATLSRLRQRKRIFFSYINRLLFPPYLCSLRWPHHQQETVVAKRRHHRWIMR